MSVCAPFYFMRHGETESNRNHIVMGQRDEPLNHRGDMQAQKASLYFSDQPQIQTICHSPLLRTKQTAYILQETLCSRYLIEIEDLKEANFGIQQGKSCGDYQWLMPWYQGENIPEAEPYTAFSLRVLAGIT